MDTPSCSERGGNLRNAGYHVADYAVLLVLWLVATPLLVYHLGSARYGLLMLANSIMGFGGLVSLGMPDANIKFISQYRGRNDMTGVANVIRTSLSLYLVLDLACVLAVFVAAPWLVIRVFALPAEMRVMGGRSLRIAALGFGARFLFNVLQSAFHGFERFDIPARISMLVNALSMLAYLALASAGLDIPFLLGATVLFLLSGLAVEAAVLKYRLVPGLRLLPGVHLRTLREMLPFGIYGWIRQLSMALTQHVDVMLVAALAGVPVVTPYTIARRLAMQPLIIVTRAAAFLFPYSGRLVERGDTATLEEVFHRSERWAAACVMGPLCALSLFGDPMLRIWMGPAFDPLAADMLRLFCMAFLLQGHTITTYNFLMGHGRARAAACIALTRGVLVIGSLWILVPMVGGMGAAISHLCRLPHAAAAYIAGRRILFKKLSARETISVLLPGLLLALIFCRPQPAPLTWPPLAVLAAAGGTALAATGGLLVLFTVLRHAVSPRTAGGSGSSFKRGRMST